MAEEDDLMQLAEIADLLEDIEELEELEEEETNISLPEEYGTEQFDDEELHFAKSMVLLQRKIDGAGMFFGKKVSVEPGVRDVIDQMLNSPAGILAKEQLSLKGIPPLEMPDDAEIDQMLEEDNEPTTKGVPMGDQKFTTMDKKD